MCMDLLSIKSKPINQLKQSALDIWRLMMDNWQCKMSSWQLFI